MEFLSLLLILILGLFILLGTFIGLKTKNSEKFVSFSLALAFGVMSGLSILELFPEAIEHLEESVTHPFLTLLLFTSIGMILLKLLHHFIPHHAHDEGIKHTKKEHIKHLNHIGIISSIALVLHNLIEGMAIFGTITNSIQMGIFVGIGVGLHNIPMGIVIGSTLETEHPKRKLWISFLISISTFLGGFMMFLLGDWINQTWILGILLSITLGMILYITLFELLEQIIHTKNKKETYYGLLIGIITLFISIFIGGHHH